MTPDKLLNSPFKFPFICLWNKRRTWHITSRVFHASLNLQAWSRSLNQVYWEQLQLLLRAGLEPWPGPPDFKSGALTTWVHCLWPSFNSGRYNSVVPMFGSNQTLLNTIQHPSESFNPLSPDIKMHILITDLNTFLVELVRRICLNIKTSYPTAVSDHFLYSCHLNVQTSSDHVKRNFLFIRA